MKAMAIAVVGCLTCGIAAPDDASAQVAGERIRVTLPSGRIVGVLAETRPDELVLALLGGGLRTVAHDEIRRLERSLGERRKAMEWAKTGALAGTVSGVGFGLDLAEFACSIGGPDDDCSGEVATVAGTALGMGLVWAGVGALAGALQREEPWETMEGCAWAGRANPRDAPVGEDCRYVGRK